VSTLARAIRHALSVQYRPIGELRRNPKNPRLHSAQQIEQLARSIEVFGFNNPILVDRHGTVVAGHGRLAAAESLKLATVPTIALEDLTPAQVRAYVIADNRLAEHATWDNTLLAENFELLAAEDLDFDLTVTGFDLPEIDLLLQEPAEGNDPDDAPIESGPVVSRLGDEWALGTHRVHCGNALDSLALDRLMQGDRAAVVFTDPPYNVKVSSVVGLGRVQHREFAMASGEMSPAEFSTFLQRACSLLAQHSTDGALHFICMDYRHIAELQAAGISVYSELKSLIVWVKDAGGMGSLYRGQHELIFLYKVGSRAHTNNIQLGRHGRNRTNVWTYPSARTFAKQGSEADLLAEHPTPKPVAMIADALMDVSNRGDIVLDTFLGSGSTLLAAERTGRIARGLELDPGYVDLTIRRWQRMTGRSAVHARLQCTFNELAEFRLGENHA